MQKEQCLCNGPCTHMAAPIPNQQTLFMPIQLCPKSVCRSIFMHVLMIIIINLLIIIIGACCAAGNGRLEHNGSNAEHNLTKTQSDNYGLSALHPFALQLHPNTR